MATQIVCDGRGSIVRSDASTRSITISAITKDFKLAGVVTIKRANGAEPDLCNDCLRVTAETMEVVGVVRGVTAGRKGRVASAELWGGRRPIDVVADILRTEETMSPRQIAERIQAQGMYQGRPVQTAAMAVNMVITKNGNAAGIRKLGRGLYGIARDVAAPQNGELAMATA